MKRRFLSHIITVLSIGVMVLVVVLLLAQNKQLNETNNRLSREIKEQTDINFRFFRCLILVPADPSRSPEERVAVVDKCAKESKAPKQTNANTNQQNNSATPAESPKATPASNSVATRPATTQSTAPATQPAPVTKPAQQTTASQPAPQSQQPQSSIIQQVTKPITDFIKRL